MTATGGSDKERLRSLVYALASLAALIDGVAVTYFVLRALRFASYSGVPVPYGVDSIMSFEVVLALAVAPLAYSYHRGISQVRRLRAQVRDFLQVAPDIVASSQSLVEALRASAQLVGQPLRGLLRSLEVAYSMSGNADEAFRRVLSRAPRDVRLLLSSILVASKSGGRAREALSVTANYAMVLARMEHIIENRLKAYSLVVFMAVALYGVASGVGISLVRLLSGLSSPFSQTATVTVSVHALYAILGVLFYAMLIISLAASYVLAKAIDDYTPRMAEYFVELTLVGTTTMVLSLLAFRM